MPGGRFSRPVPEAAGSNPHQTGDRRGPPRTTGVIRRRGRGGSTGEGGNATSHSRDTQPSGILPKKVKLY